MKFFKKFDAKIEKEVNKMYEEKLKKELEEVEKKYAELIAKIPQSTTEYANRVADLEIKMAKLWSLLLEQTPRGQDKLSKFGKRFGGQCRNMVDRK